MTTIEAMLRRAIEASGPDLILTLDPVFQGLPDAAHGGSVLAVFDALAGVAGAREVSRVYRRRVPLCAPFTIAPTRPHTTQTLLLPDGPRNPLYRPVPPAPAAPPHARAPDGGGAPALPISRACFACGPHTALGLRAELGFDEDAVGATWRPRDGFRRADGSLAPAALTALLDEAAFWLGALKTGESGMTTELRVTLHGPAPFGSPVVVRGARAAVQARAGDQRYWDTDVEARIDGAVVATAGITFVAVRGAARRLVTGMLAINDPARVQRVFPAYTR